MVALDRRYGAALRIGALHAQRRGEITHEQRIKVRDAVRTNAAAVGESQQQVLEHCFCAGLVDSADAVPKEIDCDQLMEILIQLLPLLITLF